MTLKFQPKIKSVLMCSFDGFVEPEMVKTRPVIVVARHRRNSKLVTVVPLSTTAPLVMELHHHEMSVNPLPDKPDVVCWVKCDMVYTVSIDRLDRYKMRSWQGREYVVPEIGAGDFSCIQDCIRVALGLNSCRG